MLIVALNTYHSFLRRYVETQSHNFHTTQLMLMRCNRNWCKLKHAQTCIYYDQVAWLPLSRAIKPSRELHSYSMCMKNAMTVEEGYVCPSVLSLDLNLCVTAIQSYRKPICASAEMSRPPRKRFAEGSSLCSFVLAF
jgi:hypothetical protein